MHISSAVKPSNWYHHRTQTLSVRAVTLLGCLKAYADSSRIKDHPLTSTRVTMTSTSKVLRFSEAVHLPFSA